MIKEFILEYKLQFEEPYEYEFIVEEPITAKKQNKKHIKKLKTYSNYKK